MRKHYLPNSLQHRSLSNRHIDRFRAGHYILGVSEQTNSQFEQALKRLETRMDDIVRVCDQLREENRSLRERQESLMNERASLLQKNELVRSKVEAMIGRLKAMESGS